jgi:hypothetical protein
LAGRPGDRQTDNNFGSPELFLTVAAALGAVFFWPRNLGGKVPKVDGARRRIKTKLISIQLIFNDGIELCETGI